MRRFTCRSRQVLLGCLVLLSLTGGGFPVPPGEAAARVVTSLADPGTGGCDRRECTLREALSAAVDGDTITFAPALFAAGPGTIALTAGTLLVGHDVTITGPGQRLLTIRGNPASGGLWILPGVVAGIQKVTIMRGHAIIGGGILNEGTLTLMQSTVRNNTASASGGGIFNNGKLRLVQSLVRSNAARAGGGLFNDRDSTLTLVQSTVSGNTADDGGGIMNFLARMTLRQSTVSGNTSANFGGGIMNRAGTLTLWKSTVSGNTAYIGGGIDNTGPLTLEQSTVSGNTADIGGGIFNASVLTLEQSTVSSNHANLAGGGLDNIGTLSLHTTIIAGNTAGASGADCLLNVPGISQSLGHNLVGTRTGCPRDLAQGDLTVGAGIVFTQVLGPLQDNGGPTFTHALLPASPALDAGDPSACPATDQRGVARPQGAGCDIGAFELAVP